MTTDRTRRSAKARTRRGGGLPLGMGAMLLAGCAPAMTELTIEVFKEPSRPERLAERFEDCYFTTDPSGNCDIVLRTSRPSPLEDDAEMTQTLHVQLFWRPIPGRTYAERTQTNARLCYAIIDVDRAISYEGAGFVYFVADRTGDAIRGEIESGSLAPGRVSGEAPDLLGRCLASGRFVARRDPRRVVSALTELRRRLGPPREYTPPGNVREVR